MRTALLLAIVCCSAACAASGEDAQAIPDVTAIWNDATAWRLGAEPMLTISAGDPRARPEGKPIDPTTVFRTRDGRWWAGVVRGDSIAGYDGGLSRLQIWDAAGNFGRTVRLPSMSSKWFMADGRAIVSQIDLADSAKFRRQRGKYTMHFNLYGADGERIAEVMKVTREMTGRDQQDAPDYDQRPVYGAGAHHWYVAEDNDFEVVVFDTTGTRLRVLRRSLPRTPFTDADREEIIRLRLKWAGMGWEAANEDQMSDLERGLRRDAKWPKLRPALQTVLEDSEGNVWLQHFYFLMAPTALPAKSTPTTWSVFDPGGRFLGEVVMPARFVAKTITSDQVLGFWSDEFDAQHVHVYQLIKPAH